MSRDISLLHPELRDICREFIVQCRAAGLIVGISQTYRTKAEQDELYAQGRTVPGSIVTNAKYPLSPHNWGLAFDIYRNDGRGAYNDADGWFSRCGHVGERLGLFWGGDFKSFKDKPHFELAKYLPNNSVDTVRRKYGTPEKYIKTWEDVMTQKDFDAMMDNYLARRRELAASTWAVPELAEAKRRGITDAEAPLAFATRQEVAVMVARAMDKK